MVRWCIRDHLLEAVYGALDLATIGNVVFHFVDERRDGDAAGVCWRIVTFTAAAS
jgi:hypothetical protein